MPMHESHEKKTYPLSSGQWEIWFDQALNPDLPLYNIGGYSRVAGPLYPFFSAPGYSGKIFNTSRLERSLSVFPH